MSYLTEASLAGAIRHAVIHNRITAVVPKSLLWTDFPDSEEDLFGPATKDEMRPPRAVSQRRPNARRQRLYARLTEGGTA